MSDVPGHWAVGVIEAVLERKHAHYLQLPEEGRRIVRNDMQCLLETRLLKLLEAELTTVKRWLYKRVKKENRLNYLLSNVPNSKIIADQALQSFIIRHTPRREFLPLSAGVADRRTKGEKNGQ